MKSHIRLTFQIILGTVPMLGRKNVLKSNKMGEIASFLIAL